MHILLQRMLRDVDVEPDMWETTHKDVLHVFWDPHRLENETQHRWSVWKLMEGASSVPEQLPANYQDIPSELDN